MTLEEVIKKHPKILHRVYPEHGEGWAWLINQLCNQLQHDIEHNKQPQIEASQVKEKFGGLRFYTLGSSDMQDAQISLVESMSYHVCEECGSTKDIGHTAPWIRTLCKTCLKDSDFTNWTPEIFDDNVF